MRNIAEIINDDKNGKQLSQTERQIAVAYNQGKYDAVMELKICNNSNAIGVLDKIRAEIEPKCDRINSLASVLPYAAHREIQELLCEIMDSYKAESEDYG